MRYLDYLKRFTYTPNEFYDYLIGVERAMAGEIALIVSPATLGSSAADVNAAITTDGKFVRRVKVELKASADGDVHQWFTGSFSAAVVANTGTGDGTAAIADGGDSVELENGVGYVDIEYTGTWAEGNTCTLTITGGTIMGYSVSNKTSVDTLVA
jgi:hypothetical protein